MLRGSLFHSDGVEGSNGDSGGGQQQGEGLRAHCVPHMHLKDYQKKCMSEYAYSSSPDVGAARRNNFTILPFFITSFIMRSFDYNKSIKLEQPQKMGNPLIALQGIK